MTNLEKLFDAMIFISNRHEAAAWTTNVPGYDFTAKLTFIKQQPKDKKNDYEWVLFSITGNGSIELRLDVKSLAADLHLPEPEFINGFPEEGLDGPGILFKIPEEWNAEYRDAEYIQKIPTVFWRCTDDQFKQRIENFNSTMERLSVSLNEFE